LRIDCDEHEALAEADREAVWTSYITASSDFAEDGRDTTR
jgi:hypothetical protein